MCVDRGSAEGRFGPRASHTSDFFSDKEGASMHSAPQATLQAELRADLPLVRECIDEEQRRFFPFKQFNSMQAACWEQLYRGTAGMVISAPTGAGKTVLFELAILGMMRREYLNGVKGTAKALYLAPLKALCAEKSEQWKAQFAPLGIEVAELTGDDEDTGAAESGSGRAVTGRACRASRAQVLVATPEMWDSFTRQLARSGEVVDRVEVVCLDEVHMLNLPRRGAVLEAIVARLRTLWRAGLEAGRHPPNRALRFIAVSASVPNVSDVGEWLGADPGDVHVFGQEYRPVPLKVLVRSFRSKGNEFQFQGSLDKELAGVLRQHSGGRGALVFCATKRSCETAARVLLQVEQHWQPDRSIRAELAQQGSQATDPVLRQFIPHGLAIHHAGLQPSDRRLVSDLFMREAVLVLFCTQTLALGVNLPARLVIVKGTTAYKNNAWEEYDQLEMLQIVGRAGRPRFDTEGVAVILTDETQAPTWRKQLLGDLVIESNLSDRLPESLLAEIVAGTVSTSVAASTWLRGTFLAVRAQKLPKRYIETFPLAGTGQTCASNHPLLGEDGPDVGEFADRLSLEELERLERVGLVRRFDRTIRATRFGEVASRYSVLMPTLLHFVESEVPQDLQEILWFLARASEFDDYRPKQGERAKLREWATGRAKKVPQITGTQPLVSIRWKIPGAIDSSSKKVMVLLQLALGESPRAQVPWDMKAQQSQIIRRCELLLRVVLELFLSRQQGLLLAACVILQKCIRRQLWEDSKMQVRQLPQIGDLAAEQLAKVGMGSLAALSTGDCRAIERCTNRRAPFGNELQAKVRAVPQVQLRLVMEGQVNAAAYLEPQLQGDFSSDAGMSALLRGNYLRFVAFAAPSGHLICQSRFPAVSCPKRVALQVPSSAAGLIAHLIHENIIGFDSMKTLGNAALTKLARTETCSDGQGPAKRKRMSQQTLPVALSQSRLTPQAEGVVDPSPVSGGTCVQEAALDRFIYRPQTKESQQGVGSWAGVSSVRSESLVAGIHQQTLAMCSSMQEQSYRVQTIRSSSANGAADTLGFQQFPSLSLKPERPTLALPTTAANQRAAVSFRGTSSSGQQEVPKPELLGCAVPVLPTASHPKLVPRRLESPRLSLSEHNAVHQTAAFPPDAWLGCASVKLVSVGEQETSTAVREAVGGLARSISSDGVPFAGCSGTNVFPSGSAEHSRFVPKEMAAASITAMADGSGRFDCIFDSIMGWGHGGS